MSTITMSFAKATFVLATFVCISNFFDTIFFSFNVFKEFNKKVSLKWKAKFQTDEKLHIKRMSTWINLELQSNCLSLDWAPAQLQLVPFSFCNFCPVFSIKINCIQKRSFHSVTNIWNSNNWDWVIWCVISETGSKEFREELTIKQNMVKLVIAGCCNLIEDVVVFGQNFVIFSPC